jgi:hypothetical protein
VTGEAQELAAFFRRAVRTAQALVLGGAALMYFLLSNGKALALGLLLGGAVSIVRYDLSFRVMAKSPPASTLVRTRLITYVLSGTALALAFWQRQQINPWTTAIGLFAMNGTIVATEWLSRRRARPGAGEARQDVEARTPDN